MIDAVIFDCDGTLLDSMPAWHALEADLAWMAGIELTPSQSDMLNANTLIQTVAYFHNIYGVGRSLPRLLEEARGILLESYRTLVKPRIGAVELVRQLHSDGIKLAVASSSPQALVRTGLERAGIYELFSCVASAEDEGASKREAHFAASVGDRLGAARANTWCIDDSAYALCAMKQAGFHTIGIYDSDIAGTLSQLATCSDHALRSFSELDYDAFVAGRYQRDFMHTQYATA